MMGTLEGAEELEAIDGQEVRTLWPLANVEAPWSDVDRLSALQNAARGDQGEGDWEDEDDLEDEEEEEDEDDELETDEEDDLEDDEEDLDEEEDEF